MNKYPSTRGSWLLVSSSQYHRKYGLSSSMLDENKIIFFGGATDSGKFSNELYLLDLNNNNKTTTLIELKSNEDIPFARHFHSQLIWKNNLYIFGGKSNGYHNDLRRFDFNTKIWCLIIPDKGSAVINACYGQSMNLYGDKLYLFGGYDNDGFCCEELYEYSTSNSKWTKIKFSKECKSIERYHHSSVVHGRSIYVFGGRTLTDTLGDLIEYKFDTRTWSTVKGSGTPPSKRWGHTATVINDSMYIFGGCDGANCFSDLFEFRFSTRIWSIVEVSSCPSGRYFHTMFSHNNNIFIVGGKDMVRIYDDIHEFRVANSDSFNTSISTLSLSESPRRSITIPSSNAPKIKLKCKYNNEFRVFSVSPNITYTEFKDKFEKQYNSEVVISYEDEEGDQITVRSGDDLEEALSFFLNRGLNVCKFNIEVSNSNNNSNNSNNNSNNHIHSGNNSHNSGNNYNFVGGSNQLGTVNNTSNGNLLLPPSFPGSNGNTQLLSSPVIQKVQLEELEKEKLKQLLKQQPQPVKITWQLGEIIGNGAFGSVFRAMNTVTGEIFALKQMKLIDQKDDALEKYFVEINFLKNCQHPNIVRYISYEKTESHLNIMMEYISGGSIATMLANFGVFQENVVRNFTRQILGGLSYLHQNLIMHRDIKGGNILVTVNGVVKLADLGAAKQMCTMQTYASHQETSGGAKTIAGTPHWMAPEVIRGTEKYNMSADIWSVGITVIEMLTGHPPFHDHGTITALFTIANLTGPPPFPQNISKELENFLANCLQINKDSRPTANNLLKLEFLQGDTNESLLLGGNLNNNDNIIQNNNNNNENNIIIIQNNNNQNNNLIQMLMNSSIKSIDTSPPDFSIDDSDDK